ncbi:hypothetical protein ACFOSW_09945 [Paenibacillus sp. GCM10012303]
MVAAFFRAKNDDAFPILPNRIAEFNGLQNNTIAGNPHRINAFRLQDVIIAGNGLQDIGWTQAEDGGEPLRLRPTV